MKKANLIITYKLLSSAGEDNLHPKHDQTQQGCVFGTVHHQRIIELIQNESDCKTPALCITHSLGGCSWLSWAGPKPSGAISHFFSFAFL